MALFYTIKKNQTIVYWRCQGRRREKKYARRAIVDEENIFYAMPKCFMWSPQKLNVPLIPISYPQFIVHFDNPCGDFIVFNGLEWVCRILFVA